MEGEDKTLICANGKWGEARCVTVRGMPGLTEQELSNQLFYFPKLTPFLPRKP